MRKKIGPFRLSGLIIGPVLGSGIIMLPPVAYGILKNGAMYAWLMILGLGIVFGYAFTRLSMLSPGNEGVPIAIGRSLGPFYRELASNYIICAVCFGPVAVLMTAAAFIQKLLPWPMLSTEAIAAIMLALCIGILLKGLRAMSTVTFILSSLTAALLLVGSIDALLASSSLALPAQLPEMKAFGYTLLLLFWAIIGWEVIGNYVEDVENPQKTLLQGMRISLVVITATYLVVVLATQSILIHGRAPVTPDAVAILTPLFGGLAAPIIGLIASGLCLTTYLMIVGGVSRLMLAKAENGRMPAVFMKKYDSGTPMAAILILSVVHALGLLLLQTDMLTMENLVTSANVFFIANAVLGLTAAFHLLKGLVLKCFIGMLILSFALMLLFSDFRIIGLALAVTVGTRYVYRRTPERFEDEEAL